MLHALRKLFRTKLTPSARTISMRKDGFDLIVSGQLTTSVHWSDVLRISTCKHDLFAVDSVCLRFDLTEERSVELWEEDTGFGGLSGLLHENFNEVPIDWLEMVVKPPFATNARLLYARYQAPAA